ncbi:MAG: DUF357 domain-containing protein [Candidatus Aenigmarchaeota archaeon]|nr:DUF357 domain-containing protein [Candidatus Aenigmarchaeota archaeon]
MKEVPREEIEKWLNKIESIVDKIEVNDTKGEQMYTNMKAYISDCKHFLKEGDFVRSFEAVVWAWAIYEICLELGVFTQIGE